MDEQNISNGKGKWSRILALVFAGLFAIFWSLGSFFFWFLLGGLVYFIFLSLYFSGIQLNFQRDSPSGDPYRPYQGSGRSSNPVSPVVRVVRIMAFSAVGFFLFLILVGIFFGEKTPAESSTASSTEEPEVPANENIDDNAKGNEFFGDGNYDSALWYYNKVLAKNPDDRDGLYNKGLTYSMKEEYGMSIPIARKCLNLYPDNNDAWWLLGYDYNEINNIDSAIYSLERAYNNDFREASFLQLMGEVYLKAGVQDKAKASYLQAIEKDADNLAAYKALIQLDPENASRYQERVTALENSK